MKAQSDALRLTTNEQGASLSHPDTGGGLIAGFLFEKNESLPSAVKRIAVEQIDLALCYLDGSSGDLNHSVHATRQSLKRLRALVALVRYELGEEVFKREWNCFRRAGRLLAGARDAAVVVDAFDSLIKHFSAELSSDAFNAERRFLEERRTARLNTSIGNDGIFEQARELLTSARQRVPTWPLTRTGFSALRRGLRRSYRDGSAGLRSVIKHPCQTNFHEWRRPVKLLWHQLQILTPLWPAMLQAQSSELQDMSNWLNENHDLDLLRNVLLESTFVSHSGDRDPLVSLVERRCRELEAAALPLGLRLYSESAGEFAKRIRGYWRAWESDHTEQTLP